MSANCIWVFAFDGNYNISCPSGQRANGNFKPPAPEYKTKWDFKFCPYCGREILIQEDAPNE